MSSLESGVIGMTQAMKHLMARWMDGRLLSSTFGEGYDGLRKLVLASWYSNHISWSMIGYPGPPFENN